MKDTKIMTCYDVDHRLREVFPELPENIIELHLYVGVNNIPTIECKFNPSMEVGGE